MVKATFIEHNGTEHTVNIRSELSLMEGALANGVPGIDADCGGSCACATCHVIVAAEWFSRSGERSDMEEAMLDFANEPQETSRLSCQIKVTEDLDGIIVHLPEAQR